MLFFLFTIVQYAHIKERVHVNSIENLNLCDKSDMKTQTNDNSDSEAVMFDWFVLKRRFDDFWRCHKAIYTKYAHTHTYTYADTNCFAML